MGGADRSGGCAAVFGGGGLVGTAWLFGIAAGLRAAGVDLAAADLVVGTSAGSIAGAMVAGGQDLAALGDLFAAAEPDEGGAGRPERPGLEPGRLNEMFAALAAARLDPLTARRQIGAFALAAKTIDERTHLDRLGALMTVRDWPATRLLVTSVDTATGEREVWDATRGVPLLRAVGASIAVPGIFPPVTIAGRRYTDGGVWSGTNADLAAGADVLLVVEPLAHLFPREPLRAELAAAAAARVVTLNPDEAAIAAFGADLMSGAAWQPAFREGLRQGTATSGELRGHWPAHRADPTTPAGATVVEV